MKKIFVLSLLLVTALCSFVSAQGSKKVYALAEPSYVYTKNGEGNLEWLATVDAGTMFDDVHRDSIIPEKINKNANTKKLEFTGVVYKGKKAYILKNSVIEEVASVCLQDRAVITKDAVVYTWGNLGAFENIFLPAGTVIITADVMPGEVFDEDLVRIYFFDNQTFWNIRSVYVRKDCISTSKGDYDAVVLAKSALAKDVSKEREIITKLLASAESKADSKDIREYVQEISNKIDAKDISQSNILPVSGVSTGVINSDGAKVNVRDCPGTNGKVVGQLSDGANIDIIEYTEMKEKIAGEEASWYKISTAGENSVTGWIFGSSIKWDEP